MCFYRRKSKNLYHQITTVTVSRSSEIAVPIAVPQQQELARLDINRLYIEHEPARLERANHVDKLYSRGDLCEKCSSLTFSDLRDSKGFLFCKKLKDLSATSACPLCCMVYMAICEDYKWDSRIANCSLAPVRLLIPRSEDAQFHHIKVVSSMEDPTLSPVEQIQLRRDFDNTLRMSSLDLFGWPIRREEVVDDIKAVILHGVFTVSTAYGTKSEQGFIFKQASSHADSDGALRLVRNWLSTCVDNHPGCACDSETVFPTRVLDLGFDESTESLKLIVPCEEPAFCGDRYAALSYCWGPPEKLRGLSYQTTAATLQARKTLITLESLPRTIQDAITLTRELGIRYLWVDALCILQGRDIEARDDWKHESSLMAKVYGNAFVTIAAAKGQSVHDDILGPRQSHPQFKYGIGIPFDKSSETNVQDMVYIRHIEFKPVGPWFDKSDKTRYFNYTDCMDEPLYSRAWCLQERILSRRVLICNRDQYAWECQSNSHTESGQSMESIGTLRLATECSDFTTPQFANLWRCIITEYSARLMTNEGDKLPAIASLARKFNGYTDERYLAGLWWTSLLDDLLWAHCSIDFGNQTQRSYPNTKRAPSWSWAALNGNVRWPSEPAAREYRSIQSGEIAYHATVIDCRTDFFDDDPYGTLEGGELVLKGPVARVNYAEVQASMHGLDWVVDAVGHVYTGNNRLFETIPPEDVLPIERLDKTDQGLILSFDCYASAHLRLERQSKDSSLGLATLDMLGEDEMKKMTPDKAIDLLKNLWVMVIHDGAMLVLKELERPKNGEESSQVFQRVGIVSQWGGRDAFWACWKEVAGDKMKEWTEVRTIAVM